MRAWEVGHWTLTDEDERYFLEVLDGADPEKWANAAFMLGVLASQSAFQRLVELADARPWTASAEARLPAREALA